MSQFYTKNLAYFLLPLLCLTTTAKSQGMDNIQADTAMQHADCQITADQILLQDLSLSEINNLLYMREEEKLARDVYQALYLQWFATVFGNITQSEQKHMDQVKVFLDAYKLEDSVNAEGGVFTDPDLQILYDELVTRGLSSKLEAFKVGALIEEIDIMDLESAIADTEIPDLKQLYGNLRNGSFNHLRAFSKQIIAIEGEYNGQVLDQHQVQQIINAEHNHGNQSNAITTDETLSNSCFTFTLQENSLAMQNGSTLEANSLITVDFSVQIDSKDVGKPANWLVVALYTPFNSNLLYSFVQENTQWITWDGNTSSLPTAFSGDSLSATNDIKVFSGQLTQLPGHFTIYSGYRLNDNNIVYTSNPL